MTEPTKKVSVYFSKEVHYEIHDLEVPLDADVDEIMRLVEEDGSYYSPQLAELQPTLTIITNEEDTND